jgi:hypothetical protein
MGRTGKAVALRQAAQLEYDALAQEHEREARLASLDISLDYALAEQVARETANGRAHNALIAGDDPYVQNAAQLVLNTALSKSARRIEGVNR